MREVQSTIRRLSKSATPVDRDITQEGTDMK